MITHGMEGKNVVVAGASSGLGRAAALAFARAGADVALLARDEGALAEVCDEVAATGRRAVAVALDVTDEPAVEAAAARIVRELGSIDVWINDAAVSVYGEVQDVPLAEMRRVMDVNYFGQVIGTRAALPHLEAAPGRPVILGVLSVLSEASTPLQSTYTASKHALDGFYRCLAEELAHRRSRVRVGTLFAPSLATPLFDHAKTYTGYRPRPLAPVYPPERYADALVRMALRPRQGVLEGAFAHVATFAFRHLPRLASWFQARTGYRAQRSRTPKRPTDGDNLLAPMPGANAVRGSTPVSPSVTARGKLGAAVVLAGVALGAWRALRR